MIALLLLSVFIDWRRNNTSLLSVKIGPLALLQELASTVYSSSSSTPPSSYRISEWLFRSPSRKIMEETASLGTNYQYWNSS
jgi:hypothetical protein